MVAGSVARRRAISSWERYQKMGQVTVCRSLSRETSQAATELFLVQGKAVHYV